MFNVAREGGINLLHLFLLAFLILLLVGMVSFLLPPVRYAIIGLGYRSGLLRCPEELHSEVIEPPDPHYSLPAWKKIPPAVIIDNCKGKTLFF